MNSYSPGSERPDTIGAMDRPEFIAVARKVLDNFDAGELDRPITETQLDSLDLMTLRAALETHRGRPISDDDWFGSGSLAELCGRLV